MEDQHVDQDVIDHLVEEAHTRGVGIGFKRGWLFGVVGGSICSSVFTAILLHVMH